MDEAIWYVISDALYVTWGAMIALYFVVSVLTLILGGSRFDWWRAPWLRGGGKPMK